MRAVLSFALLLCTASFAAPAAAQGFIAPVVIISPQQPSFVITTDGERVEGTIATYLVANGMRSLTLKTASGEKLRYKAADLKEVGNKLGGLAKFGTMSSQIDSKWDLFTADWSEMAEREWVYFRQVLMPNGKNYALLQQVNPGWDASIKVYNIDPEESEEYFVSKDGAAAMKVDKKNYKKSFAALFDGCAAVTESDAAKKPKIKEFAVATYVFNKECAAN